VNLLAARVVLRPRPLADLLDLAVPFCLASRRLLARLVLTALAPPLALCLYGRFVAGWSWAAVWSVAVLAGGLMEGVFTVAFGDLLFAGDEAVLARRVWGRFARRLLPYLGVLLVSRVLIGLSLLFLPVLPFTTVCLLFVREVVLLESAPVFGGIGRAFRFVRRQVGSCLGLLLAILVAPAAMALAAELLGDGLVADVLQLGSPFGKMFHDGGWEGGSGYALVGFFLSIPVTAAARFLKYIDVRTRKEGWDIQLRFTAAATAEREAQPDQRGSAA
jgi:hypothetical protein